MPRFDLAPHSVSRRQDLPSFELETACRTQDSSRTICSRTSVLAKLAASRLDRTTRPSASATCANSRYRRSRSWSSSGLRRFLTRSTTISPPQHASSKLALARRAVLERLFASLASEAVLGESLSGIDAGWSPLCEERPPHGNEWGVLKVSAVTSGRFRPNESKTVPRFLGVRRELVVHKGDVLMSRANGVASLVGVVCQVRDLEGRQLTISDKTLRLRPNPSLDSSYLTIALSRDAVRSQVGGVLNGSTGQNNISQREIRRLRLAVPERDVQSHIVNAARLFDTRLQAETQRATALGALRSGLVDHLLAGHLRVPM